MNMRTIGTIRCMPCNRTVTVKEGEEVAEYCWKCGDEMYLSRQLVDTVLVDLRSRITELLDKLALKNKDVTIMQGHLRDANKEIENLRDRCAALRVDNEIVDKKYGRLATKYERVFEQHEKFVKAHNRLREAYMEYTTPIQRQRYLVGRWENDDMIEEGLQGRRTMPNQAIGYGLYMGEGLDKQDTAVAEKEDFITAMTKHKSGLQQATVYEEGELATCQNCDVTIYGGGVPLYCPCCGERSTWSVKRIRF